MYFRCDGHGKKNNLNIQTTNKPIRTKTWLFYMSGFPYSNSMKGLSFFWTLMDAPDWVVLHSGDCSRSGNLVNLQLRLTTQSRPDRPAVNTRPAVNNTQPAGRTPLSSLSSLYSYQCVVAGSGIRYKSSIIMSCVAHLVQWKTGQLYQLPSYPRLPRDLPSSAVTTQAKM